MSLRLRLGLVYFAVALFFLGAVVLAARAFTLVAKESDEVIVRDSAMIQELGHLRREVDGAVKASRLATTRRETSYTVSLKRKTAHQSLDKLRESALPEESAPFDRMASQWALVNAAMERMETHRNQAGSIFRKEILPALSGLGQAIQEMEVLRRATSFRRVLRIQEVIKTTRLKLMILVGLMALAAVSLVLILKHTILRPLELLARATDRVAQGDFAHQIAPQSRRDEITALIGHFNDMSRRLAEAERMKKEFVSIVTHEMRTPITLLRGYAEILALPMSETTEEERQRALEIIGRETVVLEELTDDFFDVAQARVGRFHVDVAPADLSQELENLLRPFEKVAQKKNISFEWNVSKLPEAVVDAKRVGQAVRNLVANAFKFTSAGGHIEVKGKSLGDRIAIETADDGPGIPAKDLPHLFERFYQRRQKAGQGRGGAGLGLAIVREIVLAHGGNVEVESEEGKGTCFRIILPLCPPQTQPPKIQGPSETNISGGASV